MKRLKRRHLRHLKSEDIGKVASQAKSHGALVQFKLMVNFLQTGVELVKNWKQSCQNSIVQGVDDPINMGLYTKDYSFSMANLIISLKNYS